jgi:hypothetical protein
LRKCGGFFLEFKYQTIPIPMSTGIERILNKIRIMTISGNPMGMVELSVGFN